MAVRVRVDVLRRTSDDVAERVDGANTIDVKDGHLMVASGTGMHAIYAPGHWVNAKVVFEPTQ